MAQIVESACIRLIRPLARIMLRLGFSAYDFSRLANIAFVQAAEDILREQGQSASFSRVSTITGLHRHVVSAISQSADASKDVKLEDKDYRRNRLARVLAGWHESPEYTGQDGRPLELPIEGPEPSFHELVRSYSGDIYPKIILDELLRVGAARLTRSGTVRAVSRRYTTGGGDPDALLHLGHAAADLLCTLEHNIAASADARLYEDCAVTDSLDARALPLLRQLVQRRGSHLLEDIEGWLEEHEPESPATRTARVRVGLHLFVDENDDTDS